MRDRNELFPEGRLDIASSPFERWQMIARTFASGALVLIGLVLWYSQEEAWARVAAFVLVLAAILLPHKCHRYLDLVRQSIVEENWYSVYAIGTSTISLAEFDKIVVCHICSSDSEGGASYTGSVGLKRISSTEILWVKEFPATADELPVEADALARKLSAATGLPYRGHPPAG